MNFRQLQESDIAFMAEHAMFDKSHWKKPEGEIAYNYTLEHEGKVLAIGGFVMIGKTCAIPWFDLSEFAKENIIITYRVIAEWSENFCREKGVKRMMAFVEVGFEAGARFCEHQRFHIEHRMPKYEDDKPFDMWVKFIEDEK